MPTSPTTTNPLANVWSEPAPIRPARQEQKLDNRVVKQQYQKHIFRCPRNSTKWIRILPNTRQSQYAGQWILSHRVVFLGDLRIIDPEFYTKRTSPFSMFHSRLKRAEPQIARLQRTQANPEGISTWPKDHGIARAIEIPTDKEEGSRISIVHASMNNGTNGQPGYLYAITEMAQATNNDPSLPRELRGTPRYKYSIVDPQHGRIVGLTRTNTYTPIIADNEDYMTLIQRIEAIAEQDPAALAMATQIGLEDLLYQSTEEEAHELLQRAYPAIYPHLFPERNTHQSTGIPSERNNGAPTESNPIADAVRKLQEHNGHGAANPLDNLQDTHAPEDPFRENGSKSPKAELDDHLDEDAMLNELLGGPQADGNAHSEAAKPYENKVLMAGDFHRVAQLSPSDPEYLTIKGRVRVSLSLLTQLTPAQIGALKKIVGEEKFNDVTGLS
jgi:hypothetical protein